MFVRLYTALLQDKEELLAAFDASNTAYRLSKLAELSPKLKFADMNELICTMDAEKAALFRSFSQNLDALSGAAVSLDEVQLLAPVVYPRQDIICLGINYAAHAIEAGHFSHTDFGGERPYTIYFSKRVNRATASGEAIPSYKGLVDSLDYEAELGVILGKDAKCVSEEDALDYVFGYTIINDVSARNLQTRHKQWYLGKSLDGFTPMGPCIVTADEIEDVQNLDISCHVNGELRQSSNTKLMIHTVASAIAELSQGITLQAGTIIATGTPAGVGMGMKPPTFLKKGDEIVCEISGIGKLVNRVE